MLGCKQAESTPISCLISSTVELFCSKAITLTATDSSFLRSYLGNEFKYLPLEDLSKGTVSDTLQLDNLRHHTLASAIFETILFLQLNGFSASTLDKW